MPETEPQPTVPPRLAWLTAEVLEVIDETPRVRSLVLNVPGWTTHRPGEHLDIRLTAEDGYQAQRSYSIASAPEAPQLVVTVERIEGGEVSPYLTEEARPGDRFELRGPIGGYFVWTDNRGGPLFLIAGGSGIAPLMSMLRHRAAAGSTAPALLLYSSRSAEDIIFRDELDRLATSGDDLRVVHTLTRRQPAGWTAPARRIDPAMLTDVGIPPAERPCIYVCGPTAMVEQATQALISLGHEPARVRAERFGATGDDDGTN